MRHGVPLEQSFLCVIFAPLFPSVPAARGGGVGGLRCQSFSFFFFPCSSADHERDLVFRVGDQYAKYEKQKPIEPHSEKKCVVVFDCILSPPQAE